MLDNLPKEIREEFQIPPYFSEQALKNYINEGVSYFSALVPSVDYEKDLQAKSLLKNYVHYAYFKKLDEFVINYNSNIVTWQMSCVGGKADEN